LRLSGSKLTIDYGVTEHRKIKYENSIVPVKEIDFGIKVQILINQQNSVERLAGRAVTQGYTLRTSRNTHLSKGV
jgi:hypothetical protein